MKTIEDPGEMPETELKVSPSIDERTVEHFFEKRADPDDKEKDEILAGLAGAMRDARENATALVTLAEAAYADKSQPVAAAAIKVRQSAEARGQNVAAKLDAALAKASTTIAEIERATAAPPAPTKAADLHLETEIRSSLRSMKREDRQKAISAAFESDNMAVIGAALRGPGFLLGMTDAEIELVRSRYRTTKFPRELDRLDRIKKAVSATETGGRSFVQLVNDAAYSKFSETADAARRKREELEATNGG